MIKINILCDIKDVPWGGGNQFLGILKSVLIKNGVYINDPLKADVVIVNSKDNLKEAANLKTNHSKVLVHRIDGVFSVYRGEHDRPNDLMVYDFNRNYVDGTIFQSEWARDASRKNGMCICEKETVIYNCSDPNLFHVTDREKGKGKITLITTSWSENIKKGFDLYRELDERLDFGRYEYIFVGRSPMRFKNINNKGVMDSRGVANELKKADVFVTATQHDACSNSLIEALSCGLPSVVLNSGGSPELLKEGGRLFCSLEEAIDGIEAVSRDVEMYRSKIQVKGNLETAQLYLDFIERVFYGKNN